MMRSGHGAYTYVVLGGILPRYQAKMCLLALTISNYIIFNIEFFYLSHFNDRNGIVVATPLVAALSNLAAEAAAASKPSHERDGRRLTRERDGNWLARRLPPCSCSPRAYTFKLRLNVDFSSLVLVQAQAQGGGVNGVGNVS